MAEHPDQKLVNALVNLVSKPAGPEPAAPRAEAAPPRRVSDIVLWSSLTNLVLLGCFLVGWNFPEVRRFLLHQPTVAASMPPEPADSDALARGLQRQLKGPLQLTLVPTSESAPEAAADPISTASLDPDEQDGDNQDQSSGDQPDQGDGGGDITVGPEDPAAHARSPMLRRAGKGGEVEIGSFTTISLAGGSTDCLDTAYGMLEDVGASRQKLKVLADSRAITVARICATNGSLIVTCRLDQITISPRRLKPNESCSG